MMRTEREKSEKIVKLLIAIILSLHHCLFPRSLSEYEIASLMTTQWVGNADKERKYLNKKTNIFLPQEPGGSFNLILCC